MSGPKHPRRRKRRQLPRKTIVLDEHSLEDINRWKRYGEQSLKFHWDYYSNLAYQRSKIAKELKQSLLEAAIRNFEFHKWQRTVSYKYSH